MAKGTWNQREWKWEAGGERERATEASRRRVPSWSPAVSVQPWEKREESFRGGEGIASDPKERIWFFEMFIHSYVLAEFASGLQVAQYTLCTKQYRVRHKIRCLAAVGFIFPKLIFIVLSQEPVIITWKSCDFIALGKNLSSYFIDSYYLWLKRLPIGNLRSCSATDLGETSSDGSRCPAGMGSLLPGKASCMLAPCHTAATHPPSTGLCRSPQWRCCHADLSRLLKSEFFSPGKHGSHQNWNFLWFIHTRTLVCRSFFFPG